MPLESFKHLARNSLKQLTMTDSWRVLAQPEWKHTWNQHLQWLSYGSWCSDTMHMPFILVASSLQN